MAGEQSLMQGKRAVPGIPLAALDAVADSHTRAVLRALVDAHHVRNGNAGSGDERFITAADLAKMQNGHAAKAQSGLQAGNGQNANPANAASNGMRQTDVARIIADVVANVIESPLFRDLGSRIALLDAPHGVVARLKDELLAIADQARHDFEQALTGVVDGITQINTISSTSTSYAARQLNAIKATVYDPTGALPLASSAILALNEVTATSSSANARALAGLNAQVNNAQTGLPTALAQIVDINDVSSTSKSANARRVAMMEAAVHDNANGLAQTRADIVALNQVEASSTSATARQLAGLIAQVNDTQTGLPRAMAMIANESRINLEQNTAFVEQNQAMYAALGGKNRSYFSSSAPTGSANAPLVVGDVWYDQANNNVPKRWNGQQWQDTSDTRIAPIEAGIVQEKNLRLSQDNQLASAIQTVWAALGGNSGLIQGGSSITVNTAGAMATSWNQVQAALKDGNGNLIASSSIKQTTQTLLDRQGQVESKWLVTLDAGGSAIGFRQAGFGISGSASSNGPSFAFGVVADTFWIAAPGDMAQGQAPSEKVPFIVKTGPWVDARGVPQGPGVFLNDLFATSAKIGVAQIKTAMIADAQVDTLKIAGNAVTLPLYLAGNGSTGSIAPGQMIQVGSVVGFYPDAADVVALISWQAGNRGVATNTRIEVRINNTWAFLAASDSVIEGMSLSHVASAKVRIGPGTHTFTVHFGNDYHRGAWDLGNWSMTLLGVMR